MSATAFPLAWPPGRPRKNWSTRADARFSTTRADREGRRPMTIATSLERLEQELDALGARYPVVSTNVELRVDGRPRSDRQPVGGDPGVAVYFQLRGKPHCLPCDTYKTVADNIAAIAAHVHATRAIERHGVATVAEMFSGFAALEAPGSKQWWDVLQVRRDAGRAAIEAAYRRLATERHPDRGGSDAMMAELNRARDEARKAVP